MDDRQFRPNPDDDMQIVKEMISALYVQVTRIYDMIAVVGDKLGADTLALSKMHEDGRLLAPDPWIRIDDEQEDDGIRRDVQPDTTDNQVL